MRYGYIPNTYKVTVYNGTAAADSREIASTFNILHCDVLKAIDRMQCSNRENIYTKRFIESSYIGRDGIRRRCIIVLKDGFGMLMSSLGFAMIACSLRYSAELTVKQMELDLRRMC